jgi:hypothetical protein
MSIQRYSCKSRQPMLSNLSIKSSSPSVGKYIIQKFSLTRRIKHVLAQVKDYDWRARAATTNYRNNRHPNAIELSIDYGFSLPPFSYSLSRKPRQGREDCDDDDARDLMDVVSSAAINHEYERSVIVSMLHRDLTNPP